MERAGSFSIFMAIEGKNPMIFFGLETYEDAVYCLQDYDRIWRVEEFEIFYDGE